MEKRYDKYDYADNHNHDDYCDDDYYDDEDDDDNFDNDDDDDDDDNDYDDNDDVLITFHQPSSLSGSVQLSQGRHSRR